MSGVVQPKRPPLGDGGAWVQVQASAGVARLGSPAEVWVHIWSSYRVLSSVEATPDAESAPSWPEYHLRISVQTPAGPERIAHDDALWVLRQFGLGDAIEDDRGPGDTIRHFKRAAAR